jgi:S-(hydroxymethyl)glutathione dehydrogenase/alcohol dehydrogenase
MASGICGAQLGEIAGVKGPDAYLPHLLGHEGAGIVSQCGPGVRHVHAGDHVVLHWRRGQGIEADLPRYKLFRGHPQTIGAGSVTTFNEFAVVSENRLTVIPKDVPFPVAALLGCAVTTGLGVITHEAKLELGQSIAVFGAGGVGLNVIQAARLGGAHPIIAVDVVPDKLAQASQFGATRVINGGVEPWKSDGIVQAWPANLPRPEIAVDTTGHPGVIESAFELLAPGGLLILVSQVRYDQHVRLQTLPMHAGKRIVGSDGGQTNPSRDIPRYIRLFQASKLELKSLITHTGSISEVNQLLGAIRAGHVGRAVINMEELC